MVRWTLKLAEFYIIIKHQASSENKVADVLSRCSQDLQEVDDIHCCSLPVVALTSRDQLLEEQKSDPAFGKIYQYLENTYLIQKLISAQSGPKTFNLLTVYSFIAKI